jgi:long-chain fatty acid transport protein
VTKLPRCKSAVLSAAIAGLLAGPSVVLASGFALPEISTAGLGTANALVANPEEVGAIVYNPAAMAFHEQSSWAAGALFIEPNFTVRTTSGRHDSEGANWIGAPMLQAALKLTDQWSAGLGVNAPFGLETKWSPGTFPPLTNTAALPSPPFAPGSSIPLSPQPRLSKLVVLDFTPTGTYRVNDNFAVSAGADIYLLQDAQLDSTLNKLRGDGSGWGFNLSAMYVKDAFSAGINFHSASTVQVDGYYTPLNSTMVSLGLLQPSQGAELDLNLPWRLAVGARYEVVEDQLAVEFDFARTGWSEFDEIKIKGDISGAVLTQDENNWEDANAYRLGITYQVLPATQLRLGYSYDETGQPRDYFSPRVPDADRQLLSIGVAQDLGQGWQVEAGYMYVKFNDNKYEGTRPYAGAGGDINGTTALAGDYEAHANLFGIEINKRFDAF